MSVESHIIKVSFCDKFQKAVRPKRPGNSHLRVLTSYFKINNQKSR